MRKIVLVVHNIRSAHNVGSMMRTADGLGISKIYLTGYTPYPNHPEDDRLPHLAARTHQQIAKTALGAEQTVNWQKVSRLDELLEKLHTDGFAIAALEQTPQAIKLSRYQPPDKIALIVGNEVDGLSETDLALADTHLVIPMRGHKESFNVAVAAAIGLYSLTVLDKPDA